MCPFCSTSAQTVTSNCTKCQKDFAICLGCLGNSADICTTCGHNFCRGCRLPALVKCNDCLVRSLQSGSSRPPRQDTKRQRPSPSAMSTTTTAPMDDSSGSQPGVLDAAIESVSATDASDQFSSSPGLALRCQPSSAELVTDATGSVRIECGDVACPGLPLFIRAIGTPDGGRYDWESNGELGAPPGREDQVILHQLTTGEVEVRVAYRVRGATYRASKRIHVHAVRFEVLELSRFCGVVGVVASDEGLLLATGRPADRVAGPAEQALATELARVTAGEADETGGYSASARVRIELDGRCPNPRHCADNWRVGFVQNLVEGVKTTRYADITYSMAFDPVLPAIDGSSDAACKPFYDPSFVKRFTDRDDTRYVVFSDSPAAGRADGAPWPWEMTVDNDAARIEFGALTRVDFRGRFRLWLAVENRCWRDFHMLREVRHPRVREAYVLLRDFTWSFTATLDVDTSRPVAGRVTSAPIPISHGDVTNGTSQPVVLGKTAEERMKTRADYDEAEVPEEFRVPLRITLTGELPDLPELPARDDEDEDERPAISDDDEDLGSTTVPSSTALRGPGASSNRTGHLDLAPNPASSGPRADSFGLGLGRSGPDSSRFGLGPSGSGPRFDSSAPSFRSSMRVNSAPDVGPAVSSPGPSLGGPGPGLGGPGPGLGGPGPASNNRSTPSGANQTPSSQTRSGPLVDYDDANDDT